MQKNLSQTSLVQWSLTDSERAISGFSRSATSDPLEERLGLSLDETRSQQSWAPAASIINSSEFSLTWQLARNSLPLSNWAFKAGQADCPDGSRCSRGVEETAVHTFYYCKGVCPLLDNVGEVTIHIDFKQLVLLDVGYVVDQACQTRSQRAACGRS